MRGCIGEQGKDDLFVVVEAYLACSHTGVFVEIRPGCVDYCDVFFFIACVVAISAFLHS